MVGLKVERLKPGMENYPEQLLFSYQASQAAQWSRIHLPMQDMWVHSLDQEDPLEEEMATQSSIFAWRIPWTEEPGGLWYIGSQGIRHD